MTILGLILILIFSSYTFFESLSVLARHSGFKIGALSMGVAIQNQVLSLNRFIGFLIAPMVGYYADTNGDTAGIASIGIIGSLVGAILLVFGYLSWIKITEFFASIGQSFLDNGYGIASIKKAFTNKVSIEFADRQSLKPNYFLAQLVTTGFAMPAVFAINIIALNHGSYSATILQLSSVISGLGNLVLNFYTYPLLAVAENADPGEADSCYRSIYIGKVVGLGAIAPAVIMMSFFV